MRPADEIAREIADGFQNMTLTASYRLECAIAAAIEKDRAEREAWLPIETAPECKRVLMGRWMSGTESRWWVQCEAHWYDWQGKREFTYYGRWDGCDDPPTHWRHNPTPPIAEESQK